MKIKAIETQYKGYRFRSRLEARWAVFFDCLGLEWLYEPEGFELGKYRYLPDFHFPSFCGRRGCYAEVKPSPEPFTKARQFVHWSDAPIVLLDSGEPAAGPYTLLEMCDDSTVRDTPVVFNSKYLYPDGSSDYRFYSFPESRDLWGNDHWGVDHAVEAARAARFEFGEEG